MTPEGAAIVLRMYEGALRSVAARAAWARQCVEAAGVSEEDYRAMSFEDGEAVIRKGRKILERAERKAGHAVDS